MRISDFPVLSKYEGRELIVTDGSTLLGADDKAGIAEIVGMCEYFVTHPEGSPAAASEYATCASCPLCTPLSCL